MNQPNSPGWYFIRSVVVVLLFLFGTLSESLAQRMSTSLQSVNYPDRFVRHNNYLGHLDPVASGLDQKDASFIMVPGLGNPDYFSFESVNYPGHYLRHQSYEIKLHKHDGSDLFKKDATFRLVSGLAGQGVFLFESLNFPGYYLRHRGFRLYIDKFDGTDLFRKDGTFRLIRGFSE